jgi:hypothetical protein
MEHGKKHSITACAFLQEPFLEYAARYPEKQYFEFTTDYFYGTESGEVYLSKQNRENFDLYTDGRDLPKYALAELADKLAPEDLKRIITCKPWRPDEDKYEEIEKITQELSHEMYDLIYKDKTKLPFVSNEKVWDLCLSEDKHFLWILAGRTLWRFDLLKQKQEKIFEVPQYISWYTDEKDTASLPGNLKRVQEGNDSKDDEATTAKDQTTNLDSITMFTLSPDNRYALFGSLKGNVYLVHLQKGHCYHLDHSKEYDLVDLRWLENNEIVIISKSSPLRSYYLDIAEITRKDN